MLRKSAFILLKAVVCLGSASAAGAADVTAPELRIERAPGTIVVDGHLDDAGWKGVPRVETWFEVNPGDNTEPGVKNVGYLAYDERFLYAAFELADPDPAKIRAPLGDRDNVPSDTDYAGIILDTRNDGKTGLLLLSNARGIQYDAVSDDAGGGEDSSPDFFWDSAARITATGWTLEIRVPFSSLRYPKEVVQTWGVMLYRNYPRQYRYQFFSTRLPRGGNCFICRSNRMVGLSGLPSGGHLVAAPYVSASQRGHPRDALGSEFVSDDPRGEVGFDLKWTPSASFALDGTVNPDFSQIESDVALIGSNERFALFFPEKRPFFLEGIELFSTPIQAVYTRTITSPRWGLRGTGKAGRVAFTGLFAEDRGGGSVILPGPNGSSTADQDFRSYVAIGRARADIGRSFVSLLATAREVDGGGHNRVFGPDFQWRPGQKDTITGQVLISHTLTPDRPSLAAECDGRDVSGHAAHVWWSHSTPKLDWFGEYRDFGEGFRADDGFVPQVGFRGGFAETGYTFRPKGLLTRLRVFSYGTGSWERDGDLIDRELSIGTGMDGKWSSFLRFWYTDGRVRAGDVVLPRQRLRYVVQFTPSRWLSRVALEGFVGEEADFANARTGTGADVRLSGTLRPTDHLELRLNASRRWLDVDPEGPAQGRLFTAQVERLRATYTFTSRVFVRAIGQYVATRRDPSLYLEETGDRDASFEGSLLFAYKLNWQTVLFVGYGDNRALSDEEVLERSDRQLFLKISYAFQR